MGFSDDVIKLNPQLMEGKAPARNPSKYHNVRTEAAGMVFSSGKEAAGVGDLIILEEQKRIFGLRLQVRFPLAGDITYVADAVYSEIVNGVLTVKVVDFKGFRTAVYRMKKKLFKDQYGIDIEEA